MLQLAYLTSEVTTGSSQSSKIADERRAMNQKGLSFEAPYQEAYEKQVLPEIEGKSLRLGRQPAIPRY